MSILSRSCFVITALGVLVNVIAVRADDYVKYKAKPVGSSVRIDGKSSAHDWSMNSTLIGGDLELPSNITLDSTQAAIAGAPADGKIPMRAQTHIPVTAFKNDHNFEGMNEVMQQAMEADKFEAIDFHLTEIAVKQGHAPNTPFQCDATGDLSIHGVTKKISMPVTIETVDKLKLKVVAKDFPINMTDYGVKPPVKLSVFTTDPDVKISFEWVVGLPKTAAK